MALDGIFINKTVTELREHTGAHVDKVYQPSKDVTVLSLRDKTGPSRLILSVKQGSVRFGLTSSRPENPEKPLMFCMLLRKYIGGGKLTDVFQDGLERTVTLSFSSVNEMGDIITPKIVLELIGGSPNLILMCDGRILDAVRRSDIETCARMIQPGAAYIPPEKAEKKNILDCDISAAAKAVCESKGRLSDVLLSGFEGFSPLICREIASRISGNADLPAQETNAEKLSAELEKIKQEAKAPGAYIIYSPDGKPFDFCFTKITQYGGGYRNEYFESCFTALDTFFVKRELEHSVAAASADIMKILKNAFSRTLKKREIRRAELGKCADREKYRIYGELIKANIHLIPPGSASCEVPNYYDGMKPVKIPLDPALSAAANASKYFKEYKKSYTAADMLEKLILQDSEDLRYIESVTDALAHTETLSGIAEIREEMRSVGLLKSASGKQRKTASSGVRTFTTPGGFTLSVGKNNRQNDELTLRTSAKQDLWFHVKDFAGSHAVLSLGGKEPGEADILFAASVAAHFSKADGSQNVPVDYTLVKYVKKPAGAKPGMVIYTNQKTLYVDPAEKNT